VKLFLNGEITEERFAQLAQQLVVGSSALDLLVCSPGGDVELAFGLHDLIAASPRIVRTCAVGRCQSAAPLIVACGAPGQRTTMPNTVWMLHSISLEEADGTLDHVEANVTWGRRMTETYARLLARYSARKDHRFWLRRMTGTDTFFGAEQALEWGLVDEIIFPA